MRCDTKTAASPRPTSNSYLLDRPQGLTSMGKMIHPSHFSRHAETVHNILLGINQLLFHCQGISYRIDVRCVILPLTYRDHRAYVATRLTRMRFPPNACHMTARDPFFELVVRAYIRDCNFRTNPLSGCDTRAMQVIRSANSQLSIHYVTILHD